MKKILAIILFAVMLLGTACAAIPQKLISSDDVIKVNAEDTTTIYTNEYAYVRGGSEWKGKNWHDILAEREKAPMLIMKNGKSGTNVTRLALLRFDISGLTADSVGTAMLTVKFTDIQKDTDVPFDIYLVGNDWKENTVTYATQPAKLDNSPVATEVVLKSTSADVTSAVKSMIAKGEKSVTLMLLQTVNTENETKIEFSKLKDGEMPHLTISQNATQTEIADTDTTAPSTEDTAVKSFYTTEYAYVRGGTAYSNKNWLTINKESNENRIFIKNGLWKNDIARLAFFRFDLTGLSVLDVGTAELYIKFSEIQKEQTVRFDLYLVDDNWKSDTVTWNTQPKKLNNTPVIANAVFGPFSTVDATEFVENMLFDGKTTFTLMLVQIDETDTVTKIDLKSSAVSYMPHFKVYKEKSSSSGSSAVKQLVADEAENKAIWDRAKQMYDEWYARYLVVKEKPLGNPTLIESDADEFGISNVARLKSLG